VRDRILRADLMATRILRHRNSVLSNNTRARVPAGMQDMAPASATIR
jgi:hypothetical protein